MMYAVAGACAVSGALAKKAKRTSAAALILADMMASWCKGVRRVTAQGLDSAAARPPVQRSDYCAEPCALRLEILFRGRDAIERGGEIRYEVVRMLDPNRKPQQRVVDSGDCAGSLIHRRMRHRRRMSNETFDATERLGQRETLEGFHETPHAIQSAFYLEADHCAEAVLLGSGD